MPLDGKAKYARAKARAIEAGFTSPRAQRTAKLKAQGKPSRDNALEYERKRIRIRGAGVDNEREYRGYNAARKQGEKAEKAWVLRYFGISARAFDRIRQENNAYHEWLAANGTAMASAANTYDTHRDGDVHNWSPMRVGYIISFHGAVVNPESNWDSLPENKGRRTRPGSGIKKMNKEQFYYLVTYSGIMSVPYFEARYGYQVVLDAAKSNGKPKP